jgi:Na+/H+-dicarboxylate symporter
VVGAFAQGEILQVLFFAILFAFGLQTLGERGKVLLGVDMAVAGIQPTAVKCSEKTVDDYRWQG